MADDAKSATSAPVEHDSQGEDKSMAVDAPAIEDKNQDIAESMANTTVDDTPANGEPTSSSPPVPPAAITEDTEMALAETIIVAPAEDSNKTPDVNKKASNGSSRRKSIIPEHKSKKLNRKKSKPILRLDAKPGELYLARMKGHPPWPSIICDEEMLPLVLITTRPITAAQPDGSFKKPEYANDGKRANERTFPIMFLHTNEFAWIVNSDLQPITPEDCRGVSEKSKSKALIEAYKIAAEDHPLPYFKELLADHQKALIEDQEARAEREAEKARRAAKAKRKSDAAGVIDADEMEVDEDEADGSKPKSKKRKKSLDSEGEEKVAKTPKTSTKLKLSTPKTPATEASGKKKGAKSKSSGRKSTARATGSDDEAADTPVEEKPLSEAELKKKKEREIRFYRHKLQKGFIARDTIPAEDELKSLSGYLSKLETHGDLESSILRVTKVNKLLKAMIKLTSIPMDEEFQFKKRSHDLLSKWQKTLQNDPVQEKDENKQEDGPEEPTTNGAEAEVNGEADKEKAGEAGKENAGEADMEKAGEVDKEKPEEATADENGGNKIGTTAEGEKELGEPSKPADAVDAGTDEPDVEVNPVGEYKPPTETVEATA